MKDKNGWHQDDAALARWWYAILLILGIFSMTCVTLGLILHWPPWTLAAAPVGIALMAWYVWPLGEGAR